MDQREDVKRLKRIAQSDLNALSQLYERYAAVLYGLALRILASPEHAEKVTGDVMLELWTDDASAGRSEDFYPWIVGRCRQRALEFRRSKEFQARTRDSEGEEPGAREGDEEAPAGSDAFSADRERVAAQLKQLSRDHVRILKLAYFKGYGPVQIARMLRMPPGTVRTRLNDGVKHLRGKDVRESKAVQEHIQAQQGVAYVLGELTGSRRQQFEQHLAGKCSICAAEVAAIGRAVHQLPLTLPVRVPSPELKQRILAKASATEKARRGAAAGARRAVPAVRPWIITALLILLAGTVGVSFLMFRELVEEIDVQNTKLTRLQEQYRTAADAVAILQRPGVLRVELAGEGTVPSARGTVVVDPATGETVLTTAGLPVAGADSLFCLWLVVRGADLRISAFEGPESEGTMVRVAKWDAPEFPVSGDVLLTLEPRGSTSRTGTIMLRSVARGR